MNQVYIGGTYFHVYISILKSIYRTDRTSKSLLILNDHTPGISEIVPALRASGYFDFVIEVPFVLLKRRIKNEISFISKALNRNKLAIDYVEQNSAIGEYGSFIRDAEINLFYNLGLSSSYFITKYRHSFFRMLEDGEHNYLPRVGRFQAFKRRHILKTVMGEGLDPEIKEIEVQHVHRLHERVRFKGKTLDLQKMQEGLTVEDQEKILSIFMNGQEITISGNDNALLVTQPLSEDGLLSEAQKIKLYNNLLQQYASDCTVYIKCHPREKTDYRGKILPTFTEIPRRFPLEMLDLLKSIKFKRGITVFSGGLNNLQCIDQKVFLGKDYLKKTKL